MNIEINQACEDQERLLKNSTTVGNGISLAMNNVMQQFTNSQFEKVKQVMNNEFSARYINIDSSTRYYHNDNDAGSTIISVPKQEKIKIGYVQFNFKINDDTFLLIPLIPGTSIHFHGKYISHRQQIFKRSSFVNISGYTNNHLLRNYCKSLKRCIQK